VTFGVVFNSLSCTPITCSADDNVPGESRQGSGRKMSWSSWNSHPYLFTFRRPAPPSAPVSLTIISFGAGDAKVITDIRHHSYYGIAYRGKKTMVRRKNGTSCCRAGLW